MKDLTELTQGFFIRLRWAGYVARMEQSRNEYRILVGRSEERNIQGD